MDGARIVFLHGGGQGSWVWEQTRWAIDRQSGGAASTLALDAPGCGTKRGAPTHRYAFADTTRELVEDIVAAGWSNVVLVGHSQAGMTMPHMAELAPEGLIRQMIYVACSAPLPGQTTLDQMGTAPRGAHADQVGYPAVPGLDALEPAEAMSARYRTMFCNDMDEAAANAFLAKMGHDSWPQSAYSYSEWHYDHLRAIPSAYVVALRDEALPVAWQERFADRLHARRIERIDAGHQVMTTRPEALAEVLLSLVAT